VTPEQERRMKTMSSDGEVDSVVMKQPTYDPKTGEQGFKNDLDDAKFDVWVDVGPSSSSKRASTVRALTGIAQITQDPEMLQVLTSASIMNMEGEGIQELRDFCRARLVRMGVVKPTEEEKQQLAAEQQGQQPDPQSQYLLAAAEQAQADAALGRAKTVDAVASADLKRAQTAKALADTMGAHNEQQIASAQALQAMLNPQIPPSQVQNI